MARLAERLHATEQAIEDARAPRHVALRMRSLYDRLHAISRAAHSSRTPVAPPQQAIVVFQHAATAQRCIAQSNCACVARPVLLRGRPLHFSPAPAPGDVAWHSVGTSAFRHQAWSAASLFAMLCLCFMTLVCMLGAREWVDSQLATSTLPDGYTCKRSVHLLPGWRLGTGPYTAAVIWDHPSCPSGQPFLRWTTELGVPVSHQSGCAELHGCIRPLVSCAPVVPFLIPRGIVFDCICSLAFETAGESVGSVLAALNMATQGDRECSLRAGRMLLSTMFTVLAAIVVVLAGALARWVLHRIAAVEPAERVDRQLRTLARVSKLASCVTTFQDASTSAFTAASVCFPVHRFR